MGYSFCRPRLRLEGQLWGQRLGLRAEVTTVDGDEFLQVTEASHQGIQTLATVGRVKLRDRGQCMDGFLVIIQKKVPKKRKNLE